MTAHRPALSVAVALAVALSGVARADDDADAAREHYHRGAKLYDLRRYHDAAKEFEAAYEAKDDPALLYNIAQAYRLAGENVEAVGAYQSYLRRNPKAPNHAEVTLAIGELQRLVRQQQRSRENPPVGVITPKIPPGPARSRHPERVAAPPSVSVAPPPSPAKLDQVRAPPVAAAPVAASEPTPGRKKKIAGAVVAAVGVALLSVGAVFAAQAAAAGDQLSNPTKGQVFDPALESRGKTDQALGAVLLPLGAVAIVAGAALFALGWRDAHRASSVTVIPSAAPGAVGALVDVRF